MNEGLLSHLCVVLGIYLSYPLRLLYRHRSKKGRTLRSWSFLRIPAAFDPATVLYPVFLPLFVASSVAPSNPAVLLANLILSIASIPRAILPIHDSFLGYSPFQWISSLIPLTISQMTGQKLCNSGAYHRQALTFSGHCETLALLFPLHQALLPTLGHLTTTSLLPAELQLLSTAMINVLLFSTSPQAIILQALLWLGGLFLFILCGRVLCWVVALARVPSWRFRHPRLRSRDGSVLLSAIEDCFHRRLRQRIYIPTSSEDSSDEGTGDNAASSLHRERPEKLKLAMPHGSGLQLDRQGPRSAIDPNFPSLNTQDDDIPETPQALKSLRRRYTLPSYLAAPRTPNVQTKLRPSGKRRPASAKTRSFTFLTNAQAIGLKWLFTTYIYAMVLIIVAWPIRIYISRRALHGYEPVGWALGYLFGQLPLFRSCILPSSLTDWIPLPESVDIYAEMAHASWVELLERHLRGPANMRLLLCVYFAGSIAVGLAVVFRLKDLAEVDTRRKVFHGMTVAMFLPATFVDPPFVALAFILVLAIFLLLDIFRASQLPPLSKPLTDFLAPYVDGRDYRGPVIVSHMFLLIGCAIPLWLSLASMKRAGKAPWEGWEVAQRNLGMVSGVICVGMGDAAASLIGRRFGRRRWYWSGGKSLEGSLAFALAVMLGLSLGRAWLLFGGWAGDSGDAWSMTMGKVTIAAMGASLAEAVLTGGNDNVIVPIMLWLMVRGLRI